MASEKETAAAAAAVAKKQAEEAAEALEAAKLAAAAEAKSPSPLVEADKSKAGDIKVIGLSHVNCNVGSRPYQIRPGVEMDMDPSHAVELAGSGHVARHQA